MLSKRAKYGLTALLLLDVHGARAGDQPRTQSRRWCSVAGRRTSAQQVIYSYGAGLNWYLTTFVKYMLDYERTTMTDGAPDRTEHALLFRLQPSVQLR